MRWVSTLVVVGAIGAGCALAGALLEQDSSAGAAVRHGLLGSAAALVRRRIRISVDIGGENGKT